MEPNGDADERVARQVVARILLATSAVALLPGTALAHGDAEGAHAHWYTWVAFVLGIGLLAGSVAADSFSDLDRDYVERAVMLGLATFVVAVATLWL